MKTLYKSVSIVESSIVPLGLSSSPLGGELTMEKTPPIANQRQKHVEALYKTDSIVKSSIVPLGLPSSPLGGRAFEGKNLSLVVQPQKQTNWCWAAVTVSVASFYNPNSKVTQCGLVNRQFGQVLCCSIGSSTQCNNPWYLDKALNQVKHLNKISAGALSFSQVKSEINSGRPLPVRIGWTSGGGHFVIIAGHWNNTTLDIQDPWSGHSTVDYDVFKLKYRGNGTWTHSYFTKSQGE